MSGRRYTRESVERALSLHYPGRWTYDGKSGYRLQTWVGTIQLRNLKEAYVAVVAAAETKRLMQQEEAGE